MRRNILGIEITTAKDYEKNDKHLNNCNNDVKIDMNYPDELNYTIPVFTPCKTSCSKAVKISRKYKEVLLEYDRDAAEELRLFNKRGYRIVRY